MQKASGCLRLLAFVSVAGCAAPAPSPSTAESPPARVTEPEPAAPTLPSPSLAVPPESRLAFALDAAGVQIYACQASDSGFGWSLKAPEASLSDRSGQAVVKHYAGPTWEWLADGSKLMATKVAAFTEDAAAIPALLLKASGHEGQGRLSDVSYVQRLATRRGLAPSTGCDAAHAGALARIDYTATYYFYH